MTDITLEEIDNINDDHGTHHPTDFDYVKVAIGLAILTALEVVLSYIDALKGAWLLTPLLIVMVIKFIIVASQFMHLRFDSKTLSRIFYASLILAVGVYIATLATFHVFSKDRCNDGFPSNGDPASCVARR